MVLDVLHEIFKRFLVSVVNAEALWWHISESFKIDRSKRLMQSIEEIVELDEHVLELGKLVRLFFSFLKNLV